MAVKKTPSSDLVFKTLSTVKESELIDHKGKFVYLSWAHAVEQLCLLFPSATWNVHLFGLENKKPFMKTDEGYFVKTSVVVEGLEKSHVHPILDNYNKPIDNPNSFEINRSIMRCLAKVIAMHGLGLSLFYGEDLPTNTREEIAEKLKLTDAEKELLLEKSEEAECRNVVEERLNSNAINRDNYNECLVELEDRIKECDRSIEND